MTFKDIQEIVNKCRNLGCTQRSVQYCTNLYKIYKKEGTGDRDTIINTCIVLGCKISNYIINNKDLLVNNSNIELEICKIMDFDFEMVDIYKNINLYVEKYKLTRLMTQYLWVFLNDTVYLETYQEDEELLIKACVKLVCMVLKIEREVETDEEIERKMSEILSIYEKK
ncbi:cyclin-like protein [Vairimorpha necatrix]|uniref:Cyclin-like protein n=1 Tax=Vairimorpha necatrix TaxID=6039 RepID=A0AAX4JA86_9MICR